MCTRDNVLLIADKLKSGLNLYSGPEVRKLDLKFYVLHIWKTSEIWRPVCFAPLYFTFATHSHLITVAVEHKQCFIIAGEIDETQFNKGHPFTVGSVEQY